MENLKQSAISKSRSYTACLSEAHRMLFDNIKLIFSRSWMYCAALAMILSAYLSIYINAMLYGYTTTLMWWAIFVSILALCAGVAYHARIMHLINGHSMKWNIIRYSTVTGCYIALVLLISLIYAAVIYGVVMVKQPVNILQLQPLLITLAGVYVVILLLLLPYIYGIMKYLMEPECTLKEMIFKSYKAGMRHWGLIFIALFLTILCIMVCAMLVSIPMFIVTTANALSVFGVNFLGDPTGLPSYFIAIQVIVFALTFFIWAYINIFTIFVCYFLYGSIKTKEKEKIEAEKELATSN